MNKRQQKKAERKHFKKTIGISFLEFSKLISRFPASLREQFAKSLNKFLKSPEILRNIYENPAILRKIHEESKNDNPTGDEK